MSKQPSVSKSQAVGPGRRIAIFSHTHPSISKGGAEIAAHTLFEGMKGLGLDPLFIAACAEQDRGRLMLGSGLERALIYQPQVYDHFYQLGSPALAGQLARILDEEGVGLVNFHHFMNIGIGSIGRGLGLLPSGRPVAKVLTLHEFLPICQHHGQMVTRPARLLCEAASPQACAACFPEHTAQKFIQRRQGFMQAFETMAGFISPSAFLAGRFADWGLDASRIRVIENGLPHAPRLAAGETRREPPWTIGYFGQINPFKGVDTLLEAAEAIAEKPELARRIRLRIHGNVIGQGEAFTQRFTGLVEKYPFLTYSGPYNNASVHRLMSACDYVLVPSNWWENSPIVIQEAYGAGRPVICSGIGGMAEKIIDGVSGLHFRVGDANHLAETIERAADPEMWATLRAGVPAVSDALRMAREYLLAYEAFVGAKAVGGSSEKQSSVADVRPRDAFTAPIAGLGRT
ncbi:MAG: hypothetical protein B7Y99_03090 [Caulobacterales bacterium 32-69-10]|nr:MAG: hypothetical protein B7Y99_03090 [Caulobacterales bacterium 32-69-10]